jgi:hypothetical protein
MKSLPGPIKIALAFLGVLVAEFILWLVFALAMEIPRFNRAVNAGIDSLAALMGAVLVGIIVLSPLIWLVLTIIQAVGDDPPPPRADPSLAPWNPEKYDRMSGRFDSR